MAGYNAAPSGNGPLKMSARKGWDTERWVAVITVGALGLLILIRMGFRGVNVMGFKAGV